MKRLFSYIAIVAALAITMVSCSKDDDKDSEENRLNFINQVMQNSTSFTWEGYETAQRKELGSWVDEKKRYTVIRFDRASTTSTSGTGRLVAFQNSYKEEFVESSDLTWYFDNDQMQITWRRAGWQPAHAEYRTGELQISTSTFKGYWFEKTDFRWQFSYIKSSFNDWNKYTD